MIMEQMDQKTSETITDHIWIKVEIEAPIKEENNNFSLHNYKESLHIKSDYTCNEGQYQTVNHVLGNENKLDVHQGMIYSCDHCNAPFKKQDKLRKHKLVFHEEVKYNCDQCE